MTLRIERPAFCPCCGQAIQGPCTSFVCGVAMCDLCSALPDACCVAGVCVDDEDTVLSELVASRGLLFYAPRDAWNRGRSAAELLAEAAERSKGRTPMGDRVEVGDGDRVVLTNTGRRVLGMAERGGRCGPAGVNGAGGDGAMRAGPSRCVGRAGDVRND